MTVFRPEIPPPVAPSIGRFPPDLKRSIKQAIRALSVNPNAGEPLRREPEGLWKYRVRRFRIVYEIDQRKRTLRIVAIGYRRQIYEALTSLLRQP